MEEDINTMHRYRDALVVRQGGPYERHAFGAYVLFPWNQEEVYQSHPFYKSINEVNIGGFPFLPNATRLVEQFVQWLIEKSPEEIQEEGILPKGMVDYWKSSLEEPVLVGRVKELSHFKTYMKHGFYHIPTKDLNKGWQEAQYVALYIPQRISNDEHTVPNGITIYGEIDQVRVMKEYEVKELASNSSEQTVCFDIKSWKRLPKTIGPVNYGISVYTMTNVNILKEAKELPELFMKSPEEVTLWRILRRLSNKVKTQLNNRDLVLASNVDAFQIEDLSINLNRKNGLLQVIKGHEQVIELPIEWLSTKPTKVFKKILSVL